MPRTAAPLAESRTRRAPSRSAPSAASSPHTNVSRVRSRSVANIAATSDSGLWSRVRLSATPIAGAVAHERAVALVGLDHEQVALARPRVAPEALALQRDQLAAGDDRRVAPGAAQDLERHRHDGGLAARARDRDRAEVRHPVRQHLGAVDDRQVAPLRLGHVGHASPRPRCETTTAAQSPPAPVPSCGTIAMPEPLELRARLGPLAAVEAAVAAAHAAAEHGLELRERAHAAAADARVVEARGRARVGHRAGAGRHDHDAGRPRRRGRTTPRSSAFESRTQPCDAGLPERRPRGSCRAGRCSARASRSPGRG